ncbi:MAG: alanine racemase [Ignavibacteriales bacterium]|nr:MAG: alanine racemase [Ignavibacteriales bacterium]
MRPTYAVIDLNRLKKNFLGIREKAGKTKIMAVIKADAYGHGVEETVSTLNSLKDKRPEYYAVAIPDEGVEFRKLKVKQPILILEPFDVMQVNKLVEHDLIATVFTDKQQGILLEGTNKHRRENPDFRIKVHVKVDTGMNRLGIPYTEAFDFIKNLFFDKTFKIDGIYTHFAGSDEPDKEFTLLQLKRFNELITKLKKEKIHIDNIHAANSGALLDIKESYFDMIRTGIVMYGYYPSKETSESIKLNPVLSLYSEVSSVKIIQKGETVSYGRTFTASKQTKIISIPIGYADGFSRGLSNKAKVIINGKLYPQIGNVTMDRIMVDVFDDDIRVGDKVTLLGKEAGLEITAYDWAEILRTIPYEILCGISKRVPRIFKS